LDPGELFGECDVVLKVVAAVLEVERQLVHEVDELVRGAAVAVEWAFESGAQLAVLPSGEQAHGVGAAKMRDAPGVGGGALHGVGLGPDAAVDPLDEGGTDEHPFAPFVLVVPGVVVSGNERIEAGDVSLWVRAEAVEETLRREPAHQRQGVPLSSRKPP
jgi:hypothetical protein